MRSALKVGVGGVVALMIVSALAISALADWNPEDPYKWVQYPDLTEMGIDVNTSFPPYLLADDFECTQPGPLTGIHVWGSWYHDLLPFGGDPLAVRFTLSIHKDIPADQNPDGYSIPGELLWLHVIEPGTFSARIWEEGMPEGWLDPPEQYEFPADFACWQYNFTIPEPEAFWQEGTPDNPVIYWLDVQAEVLDQEARFGWKTSMDHWNDDAVWGDGIEPYDGPWWELRYPPQHEQAGQSIDLAFVLQGGEVPLDEDFGDAPDPTYPTLLSSIGAHHVIVPGGPMLGNRIDAEPDGQPDPLALGDDNTNLDDEDGVQFSAPLFVGQTNLITVNTPTGGFLDAFADLNIDGDWVDAGEHFAASFFLNPGSNAVPITIPAGSPPGLQTFLRFRISGQGGLGVRGLAPDGEVEDYEAVFEIQEPELDFGDAPDPSYPTVLASNGARHVIVPGFILGASIDAEPNGQPHPLALGDDNDGNDDEDGVTFTSPLIPGSAGTVDIVAPGGGLLDAWIDFAGDGGWAEAGDRIFASQVLVPGLNSLSFAVPSGAGGYTSFARFRLSANGGLSFDGFAPEGEVEDVQVFIDEGRASIGDRVWDDLNQNGLQDAGEPGHPGVQVDLLDATGLVVGTATTNAAGDYLFTGLNPGSYALHFHLPAGYLFTPQDVGADDTIDSDCDPSGLTPFTMLSPGEVDLTWDAGLIVEPSGGLGDRVWEDLNHNGIQDGGEPGVPGVVVELIDANGNLIATATTGGAGLYGFSGLSAGSYRLHFYLPAAYVWSPQDQGADDTVDSDVDAGGHTPWIALAAGQVDPTWDAGMYMPQAFKWEQFPDLTPMGIDVNSQEPFLLADDFLCTVSGPITEVWVWGSWLGDYYPFGQQPDQVMFILSFHTDIPAEENPNGYSEPGPPLWAKFFQPGQFLVEPFAEGPEGWMDPPDGYLFPGDHHCWLYRFVLDIDDTFWQYGNPDWPQVLWLDVQAIPLDPEAHFGWKTSEMHWNDDAVWGMGPEPYFGPWEELRYPPGHEYQGESIDLAFTLGGEDLPLSLDFGDAPDPAFPTLLASGGARHVLVSGMFLGDSVDSEPDGQPDPNANGDDSDGNDDEDGVLFVSALIPGGNAQVEVRASRVGRLDAWIDFDGDGTWTQPSDQVFASLAIVPGINLLSFTVPANGLAGHQSFARFRYSIGGAGAPTGVAYGGEVEDHVVWIEDDVTESPDALPERFGLRQNVPNPFNPITIIGVDVPAGGGHVRLEIFDPSGRHLATLMDGFATPGRHTLTWRGTDAQDRELPSGVYLYRLEAPGYDRTMKMLLLR